MGGAGLVGAWRRFRGRAIRTIRREIREMGLVDEKRRIFPWGFKDQGLERKYKNHFHITFSDNNKSFIVLASTVGTVGHVFAMCKYWLDDEKNYIGFGLSCWRTLFGIFLAYHFSQPHLSSWSKSVTNWSMKIFVWTLPGSHCLEALTTTASHSRLMFETAVFAASFPYLWPDYFFTQTWSTLVCWTPVLMHVVIYQTVPSFEFGARWVGHAFTCNVISLIWAAWLGVNRRTKYLESLPAHRRPGGSSRSRSPSRRGISPSRARARSPGPPPAAESRRRRSLSPGARGRPTFGRGRRASPSRVPLSGDDGQQVGEELSLQDLCLPPLSEAGSGGSRSASQGSGPDTDPQPRSPFGSPTPPQTQLEARNQTLADALQGQSRGGRGMSDVEPEGGGGSRSPKDRAPGDQYGRVDVEPEGEGNFLSDRGAPASVPE